MDARAVDPVHVEDYTFTIPADLSNIIAIDAGGWHSLALKADYTVVAWGDDQWGQAEVPPGLSQVIAVAAGAGGACASAGG
jgi:alpha-tubulin suppressor-like RCC1 family protein